jgi:hypothetical protein
VTPTALERLTAAIEGARRVPLTDSIRVDSEELADSIAQAWVEAPWAVPALTRLEQLVEAGQPVPLTSEVRISRREARALLEQARKAGRIPEGFASRKSRKRLPLLSKLSRRSTPAQEETQQSVRG